MIDNEDWLKYRSWDLYFGTKPVDDLATLLKVLKNPTDPVSAVMKFVRLPVWNAAPASLVHEVADWLESKGLVPNQTTKAFFHGNQYVTAEEHLAEADRQDKLSTKLAEEASQLEREGKNSVAFVRGFQSVVASRAASDHRRMASEIRKGGVGSGVRGHDTAETTSARQVDAGRNRVSSDREHKEHEAGLSRHLEGINTETGKGHRLSADRHKIAAAYHFLRLVGEDDKVEKGGAGSGRYPKGSLLASAGLPTEGWSIKEDVKSNLGGKFRGDKPTNTPVYKITTPNGNTIVVPKRKGENAWNLNKTETADIINYFEKITSNHTLDLANNKGANGDAGGWIHQSNPTVINLACMTEFRDSYISEPEYASRARANPLIIGNAGTTVSLGSNCVEKAQLAIGHELGHSDFYAEGHQIQEIFKAINDTLAENNQPTFDFDGEISQGLNDQVNEWRGRNIAGIYMPGEPNNRVAVADWKEFSLRVNDGSCPLRSNVKAELRKLGVTQYGSSSLQETIAESHAIYLHPEIPPTPLVLRLADALGWGTTKERVSKARSRVIGATIYDNFNAGTPMIETDQGFIPII